MGEEQPVNAKDAKGAKGVRTPVNEKLGTLAAMEKTQIATAMPEGYPEKQ